MRGRILHFKAGLVLVFLVLMASDMQAAGKPNGKAPFATNDIFQSAVFQQNNSLVPDYEGQKIEYFLQYDHITAYFTEKGVLYRLGPVPADTLDAKEKAKSREADEDEPVPAYTALVNMNWQNANPHPAIVAGGKAPGYHVYLDGDRDNYKTITTNGYKTITYKDLYPGIDVQYSFPDKGGIKYNLIVSPGADITQVKLLYSGQLEGLTKNEQGDVTIHTKAGNLLEHAPVSFTSGGTAVASAYSVNGHYLKFNFPQGYDNTQTLTVDPWITATVFSPDNMGFDIGYDTTGAAIVYGCGPTTDQSQTAFFEVSKWSAAGVFAWTFNGTVASITWSSLWNGGGGYYRNYAGNIVIERSTDKIYVSKGHDDNGTVVIRLTPAGVYDNFASTVNANFREDWGIGYNCVNNSLLGLGGSDASNINMAIINTTTGTTVNNNITGTGTGAGFQHEDIICGVFDNVGNLYVIMDDYTDPHAIPYTNTMYRVNATFNGYIWVTNSGYTPFSEEQNANFWQTNGSTNWSNCLAANSSYLYYYDGSVLTAYSFTAGTPVGTPITIAGYTATNQDGIAVDDCNNVYIGGVGVIKTYTFNGATFTPGASIPLGGAFNSAAVTDVKYDAANNLLYVTGVGFVGTYTATLSTGCNPISVASTCSTATATVTGASGVNFTYTWTNSTGTVVSTTANTTSTTNTATGLSNGKYYIRVAWQANCNGSIISDSVTINCNATVTVNDSTICNGGTAKLTANGTPAGGTYSWAPGGSTANPLSVSPTTTSTYTVTYTSPTGQTATATSTVTVINTTPTVQVNDTTICSGGTAVVYATPSIAGGTYLWAPGGATTSSITVSPAATTTYTVTYTLPCGNATNSGTVTVNNTVPTVHVNDTAICNGTSAVVYATPSVGGGTYLWSPGGATTSSITVSPATTSTYTVTYTLSCGTATASGTVTIINAPNVNVNSPSICSGGTAMLTATANPAGGSYLWSNAATTNPISVSPTTTTSYTVTYTSLNCGTATASGTVSVIANANVTVTDTTICPGGTATIYAAATVTGGTYAWNTGTSTTDSLTVSPAATTTYTVTFTPVGCAAATNTGTVTIAVPPTVTLTERNPICSKPGEITATVTGGTSPYEYSLGGGAYQEADSFTNLTSGPYTVQVMDTMGCLSNIANTNIAPYTALSMMLTVDSITCSSPTGEIIAAALGGNSPLQYSINGGAFQASGVFSGLPVGTDTIEVEDAAGCTLIETATLLPAGTIAVVPTADSVLCFGTNTGAVIAVASGGNPPYQYQLNGGAYQNSGVFNSQFAGNYSVQVKDANGCLANAPVQVMQPPAFQFVSVIATPVKCPPPAPPTGTITVVASGGTPPYSYSCTSGSSNFEFPSGNSITGLDTGTYTILLNDNKGCIIDDSVFVSGPVPDLFIVTTDSTSCYGSQWKDGSLTVQGLTAQNGPFQYSLDGGPFQSSGVFSGLGAGVYNVEAMDTNGCKVNLTPDTVGSPGPSYALAYPWDTTINVDQPLQLTSLLAGDGASSPDITYMWSPSFGLSCVECQSPSFASYAEQNKYTVTIVYNGHCAVDTSVIINVKLKTQVFIPDVFTPNGDGNNDVFFIYGYGIERVDLKVFNRWGEKVFESHDQFWGWDGTYKGVLQMPSVFVYEAEIYFLDGTERFYKGSVTLVR